MPRARKVCSTSGCTETVPAGTSRCDPCVKAADQRRGTASQRGYNSKGHAEFRARVLARDPVCVVCNQAWSTVADHYPLSRKELIEAGLNPDDPKHGRGVCKPCHDHETSRHQPGGWHAHT